MVKDFKHQRGDIYLTIHLLKAEIRDEWETLKTQGEGITGKMAVVSEVAGQTAGSIVAAAEPLANVIEERDDRIKKALYSMGTGRIRLVHKFI